MSNGNMGNGNMGNSNMGNSNMGNSNMGNSNENENMGNSEEDIGELINKLQEIMDEVNTNTEKDIFIRRVSALLPKARDIDNNIPGAGMEQQITQKITDILIKYDPSLKNHNYNALSSNVYRNYVQDN